MTNQLQIMLDLASTQGLFVYGVADDVFVIKSSPRGRRLNRPGDVFEMIEWLEGNA